MYEKALEYAKLHHKWQTRRWWEDYINHPIRVADAMETDLEKCVAVLHDIMEDCDVSLRMLIEEFWPEIAWSVAQLTKVEWVDYLDYIANISKDELCTKVKKADISDNLGDTPTDKQKMKYWRALWLLNM